MEREVQPDLFKEIPTIKKRRYNLRRFFPREVFTLQLRCENLVFGMVCVLMLFVLLFALGVERGKYLGSRQSANIGKDKIVAKTPSAQNLPDSKLTTKTPTSATIRLAKSNNKNESRIIKFPYTIQILTYKSRRLAEKELLRLKKGGYKPFILHSSGYYQICIGKYPSKEKAKKDLNKLKRSYQDCFIRRIK